ncbi:MAG: site-2 protease family protein [Candidatus Diapherotrites archaeon]|nr:site-2 protease family protein [Candidatus Diapherotrites archaeon]
MANFVLGKVKGISIELHPTFLLLIIAIFGFLLVFDAKSLASTMLLLAFLFISVLLHELSHSLVALSKGFKIKSITLLPIGGVAQAEELPEKPKDELLIAIAGPFFNFAMVFGILAIGYALIPQAKLLPSLELLQNPDNLGLLIEKFPLFALLWVNLLLGSFNLFVPALPMDGGRVLRSLLAFRMPFEKATGIATKISSFIALIMAIFGILSGDFWLILIAAFVWIGAMSEMQSVSIKQTLRPVHFEKIISQKPKAFSGLLNLEDAFEKMQEKNQVESLVELEKGFGFVSIELMSSVKRASWFETRLSDIAVKIPAVLASTPADKILQTMNQSGIPFIELVKNHEFAGIVSEKDLTKLYRLQKAENAP